MRPPRHDDGELGAVHRMTADRRRAALRALAALAAAAALGTAWRAVGEHVRAYARGEIDLAGEPRYEPRHPVRPEARARIDFARVHEELLPAWTIALGRATTPARRARADRAFEELERALSPDRNLADLLRGAHEVLRDDPIAGARRLDYLLWAYNDYLDDHGVPWRVEASLVLGERRAIFRALTYEVLADTRVRGGHRLRLLRRADRTNALEAWLGHAGREDEGAMILMERVLHFTVHTVWPGLHPAIDARRPATERPWLGYVRREVAAALPSATLRLLEETALDRQAVLEVQAAVESRRACSGFSLRAIAVNGLSHRDRARVLAAIAPSDAACPRITLDEAARLVGASERLAARDGLEEAIEQLTMVVARSVAAHELRHVADGEDLACVRCPKGLVGIARAEVSAYLSAFATEGTGYLALLQACATRRGRGAHGAALDAVLDAILPYGCAGPTRHDLYEHAERIERALFGKRARIETASLPPRVPLLPRRSDRARTAPAPRPLESGWGVVIAPQGTALRAADGSSRDP